MSLLEVPYNEIDIEIRYLVWLINQFPGITTTASCVGHDTFPNRGAGITFSVDTQEHLAAFVSALPDLAWRAGFVANQAQWHTLWIDLAMFQDGLNYSLNIDGYPQYVQRTLVGTVEKALKKALGILPP